VSAKKKNERRIQNGWRRSNTGDVRTTKKPQKSCCIGRRERNYSRNTLYVEIEAKWSRVPILENIPAAEGLYQDETETAFLVVMKSSFVGCASCPLVIIEK
jgi:hypothetical protein